MQDRIMRLGVAVALAATVAGIASTSAAADEVTVGDVTVSVPGLTIDAGSNANPIVIDTDSSGGSSGSSASAGSTSVSVTP